MSFLSHNFKNQKAEFLALNLDSTTYLSAEACNESFTRLMQERYGSRNPLVIFV